MTGAASAASAVELMGPDDGGFYTSNLSDWVPLCPQLKDSSVRLYWIMRALVIEKWGSVRKLSLAELCHLLPAKPTAPGEHPKPSSLSRIRGLMRELTEVGLITTPEGRPITTSSRARASADALRIRINDRPATDYQGPRNAFAVLDAARGPAAEAAHAAAARERTRDHEEPDCGAGQISDPRGQISAPVGQISAPDHAVDVGRRDAPLSLAPQSSRSVPLPDAAGNPAGGDVMPSGPQPSRSRRGAPAPSGPRLIRTKERQLPPGAEQVIAAIPPEVCRPGTIPWVGLRRAIADLLKGNAAHGIVARSPEQVIARMNRCWYQGRGPERSVPSYVPACDHEGDQPIRNPSSWLAAAILQQDCPRPDCEDGVLLTDEAPCQVCRERRAEASAAREGARRALEALRTSAAPAPPARSGRAAYDDARAGEEERIRQVLSRSGMFGQRLEYQVRVSLAAWEARAHLTDAAPR
ncbi:hypothetical protein ACFWPU_43635 [Streptomyces sp. NPDC058471]|uniref:hypothetical protein n=1 Tax=Streptomyces sp. NPDC058471 TaxID=3346516 RepID=UPI0036695630